jgi:hypothetical protein
MTTEQLETGLAFAVSWVGNPVSMWLAINRKPFGWWIVAGTQLAFCAFAVIGHHWEFGGQALCLLMGCYGVWKWQIRRDHEPAIGRAVGGPVVTAQPALIGPPSAPWQSPQATHRVPAMRAHPARRTPRPALEQETRTQAIPPPRPEDAAMARETRMRVIAEDALAELNRHAPREAQRLRVRLEGARP